MTRLLPSVRQAERLQDGADLGAELLRDLDLLVLDLGLRLGRRLDEARVREDGLDAVRRGTVALRRAAQRSDLRVREVRHGLLLGGLLVRAALLGVERRRDGLDVTRREQVGARRAGLAGELLAGVVRRGDGGRR